MLIALLSSLLSFHDLRRVFARPRSNGFISAKDGLPMMTTLKLNDSVELLKDVPDRNLSKGAREPLCSSSQSLAPLTKLSLSLRTAQP
jgi:hypothetical protein